MTKLGLHTIEGGKLPTVPLKDDSVADVRALLLVLYRGFEQTYRNPESMAFDGALSILRLSHKYQMEQLRLSMVNLLKFSWPLNYETYRWLMGTLSLPERKERLDKCAKLIHVARLLEAYELLPAAFFELAASNCSQWIEGIDGTTFLSSADWHRIMIGKTATWPRRFKKLLVKDILPVRAVGHQCTDSKGNTIRYDGFDYITQCCSVPCFHV
ncbi:hypothetical protein M422DRAFT_256774 [Sphaerobolus stellatus SS14]|uniref:BTB domain-containing protein n=1 Tax=Sphaerobolus stellatus (strain SS14) TaxID=990650 RepID=A0A0C9UAR4_SPHS4|nr:hypothetical protein M422DRAFT_256774 [Sphaerobolus stellatus SS14]